MRLTFSYFRRHDPVLWIRVFGTGLCALTTFMIRPFLIFYISDKLGGTVLMPLLVVGLQPLAGIMLSFWGGGWLTVTGASLLCLYPWLFRLCPCLVLYLPIPCGC